MATAWLTSTNQVIQYFDSSGNIGLFNSDPTSPLDVGASANFRSNLNVDGQIMINNPNIDSILLGSPTFSNQPFSLSLMRSNASLDICSAEGLGQFSSNAVGQGDFIIRSTSSTGNGYNRILIQNESLGCAISVCNNLVGINQPYAAYNLDVNGYLRVGNNTYTATNPAGGYNALTLGNNAAGVGVSYMDSPSNYWFTNTAGAQFSFYNDQYWTQNRNAIFTIYKTGVVLCQSNLNVNGLINASSLYMTSGLVSLSGGVSSVQAYDTNFPIYGMGLSRGGGTANLGPGCVSLGGYNGLYFFNQNGTNPGLTMINNIVTISNLNSPVVTWTSNQISSLSSWSNSPRNIVKSLDTSNAIDITCSWSTVSQNPSYRIVLELTQSIGDPTNFGSKKTRLAIGASNYSIAYMESADSFGSTILAYGSLSISQSASNTTSVTLASTTNWSTSGAISHTFACDLISGPLSIGQISLS